MIAHHHYARIAIWSMFMHPLYNYAATIKKKMRFSRILGHTIGEAVNWSSPEVVKKTILALTDKLLSHHSNNFCKGRPDLSVLRRECIEVILNNIHNRAVNHDLALQAAARIASLAPLDPDAFLLYLAVFWIVNYDLIMTLRSSIRTPCVAIHMTCRSRVDRADKSIESFSAVPSCVMTHIKLVGNGSTYAFNLEETLLEVPARDHYESLPAKIFLGFFIIVLACNPSCIIKLDDDHRLVRYALLAKALKKAMCWKGPVQIGSLYVLPFPSAHDRGWHIGKCSGEMWTSRPVEMPSPLIWASGEFGYILNRQALWRIAWATLYYRQWLDVIVYEDIAVGEVADKTWIRKLDHNISACISTADKY